MSLNSSRLTCEALEARDCPVASSLFNGVLTITGTDGNDTITVTESDGRVWAAGRSFSADSVSRIVITAGAGDDVISEATGRGSVIYGGMGNDTIRGGVGRDTIYGGHGNDAITGGRGGDLLYGGAGDDTLTDVHGQNELYPDGPYVRQTNTNLENEVVRLVNEIRAGAGLGTLAINQQLNAAAELHTLDMVAISNAYGPQQALQHTLYGTTRPRISDRLDAVGYDQWTRSIRYGENIAFGFKTAADVVNAWMSSPSHRENLLNPEFVETGVFAQADAAGRIFFTQTFGVRT